MSWTLRSPYCLEHTESGARVTKGRGLNAEGALVPIYLAYGPDRSAGWSYRAWSSGSAPHWSGTEPKVRYALGEPIPQPPAFLGRFASADEAKAAVEAYLNDFAAPCGTAPAVSGDSSCGERYA